MRTGPTFAAFVLTGALASTLAAQRTIRVPADQPTIQAGIAAATGGDTVLVAPGTYAEQIDTLGKAVTLRSEGGADVTTIDSQGMDGWLDPPSAPVVRMIGGEGPATVIEGFTITGGAHPSSAAGGIWCYGLSPTIRDCVITGNRSSYGGAGVKGDATLERCAITDNDAWPYGSGGGVDGAVTIVECTIAGNRSGGPGGGVHAEGPSTIVDSVIDGNSAGNGVDGYGGGGVYGPATLERCLVTNNVGNHDLDGGPPDTVGTGLQFVAGVSRCTVAFNRVGNPPATGVDPSGGIFGAGYVVDSILYGNDVADVAAGAMSPVAYTLVGSGFPGVGNLTGDPLFVDAASGDLALQPTSPCIDAGDPASPPDADGTVADMGALAFFQHTASFALDLGSGVNPASYQTTANPVLGTTWTATFDASLHAGAPSLAAMFGVVLPGAPLPTGIGELLIHPLGAPVVSTTSPIVGGYASFAVAIPPGLALSGVTVFTQALAVGSGLELANAIELLLGG